jgi:hypothetical protein
VRDKGEASVALMDLWTSGQTLLKAGLRFTVGEYRVFAGYGGYLAKGASDVAESACTDRNTSSGAYLPSALLANRPKPLIGFEMEDRRKYPVLKLTKRRIFVVIAKRLRDPF